MTRLVLLVYKSFGRPMRRSEMSSEYRTRTTGKTRSSSPYTPHGLVHAIKLKDVFFLINGTRRMHCFYHLNVDVFEIDDGKGDFGFRKSPG